ncbi:MAG: PqqD family protein [Anaerolineales bacterium]|nr:PqqD family protein [Anaerolineales bacterium]
MTTNNIMRINTPHVIHEIIDGEAVLVNLESGNYYSMDQVGAFVWNMIDRKAQIGQIIDSVMNCYSGSREEIESGIRQLFVQLEEEELIVPAKQEIDSGQPVDTAFEGEKTDFIAPVLQKYTDMVDLLLLDPIHEVDDTGWPNMPED